MPCLARQIQPDTGIIIDLTYLAKPRVRKMEYLALVRDGSEGQLVPGYWCVDVHAYLKGKRILPLALDVFSLEDPAVGGQKHVPLADEGLQDRCRGLHRPASRSGGMPPSLAGLTTMRTVRIRPSAVSKVTAPWGLPSAR